jgi:hypothetical protein
MQENILLKRRQLRQLNESVQDSVKSLKEPNPEYSVLKGKLDDTVMKLQLTRSSLTLMTAKQPELAGRIDALRQFLASHLKLEDELADSQKRHDAGRSELERAQAACEAALKSLEPVPEINRLAQVPTEPVGVPRPVYFVAVVVAALLAGRLGMSAAFRLSGGVASEFELSRIAALPVTASISAVSGSEAERSLRLRKRIGLGILLAAAAIVIAAAIVLLACGSPSAISGG